MPHAKQHEGDHEGVDDAPLSPVPFICRDRLVEVISNPEGEGHVPTPPEVGDRFCHEWAIEVRRQAIAEHHGPTDSHVRVAGEVGIKFDGVQ